MHFPFQIFRTVPAYDFVGYRKAGFALTLFGVAATLVSLAVNGLNFGIDFSGGVVMEVRTEQAADINKMRGLLETAQTKNASLQSVGSDGRQVLIRLKPEGDANQNQVSQAVRSTLDAGYGAPIEYLRMDYVGPQVGGELIRGSFLALTFAMIAMMFYLWFRFEWQYGLGGIVALLHDAVLVVGFYSVTGIEFNLTSVAALLTVIGYSINDSVVIYDRVREDLRKYKVKPVADVINLACNETLARTFLTGGTVLMALIGLVTLGGEVLFGFSAAMIFGVIVGTYSSIYVSSTILIYLNLRRSELASLKA
ncbi:MAG: protein translocase subunit SecF [Alphaproteobacteria bacterium]|nr:protein translocase subunit SecF [Alphaproteobacteria bacterium]